jgi:prepilin signal peptidase PulO-like enzyme (type II secretory pathway)
MMQNQSDTIAIYAPHGNAVLALISLTLVLHNQEEYLAYPAFFASAGGRLGQWFPAAGLARTARRLPRALLLATVLPLLVIAAAFVIGSHALLLAALFIEIILLVNAAGHSLTALLLGSYVPGLITAVVINLPVGIYVLERALREPWIRPNAAWQLIGVAIALHLIWHSSMYWRTR